MTDKQSLIHNRRIIALTAAVLIVILVVSMYAIYRSSFPLSKGSRASIISGPVEFSVETDRSDFHQGENMSVRVSLRNIGNKTITLTYGGYYMSLDKRAYFDFHVLDENYTRIYRWSQLHGETLAGRILVINASEQVTSYFSWYMAYDYPNDTTLVAPGKYWIIGSTRQAGLSIDGRENVLLDLETPSIAITIT